MNVYRIEMKVAVTMYVKARSEDEARKLAAHYECTEVGVALDDPDLPDVSLSPVGMLHTGKMKTVELAEEGV